MRTTSEKTIDTSGKCYSGREFRFGFRWTVLCLTLSAQLALVADVSSGVFPAGLTGTFIETNCDYFGLDSNYVLKRKPMGPGSATLTMLSKDLADTVTFSSSHPHLVKPKSSISLPASTAGQSFRKTETTVRFNEPDKPTNIQLFVKSSYPTSQNNSDSFFNDLTAGGVSVEELRLYPYLKFQGLTSSVENKTIRTHTPISVLSHFSYAVPDSSAPYKISFAAARFQFGTDPTYHVAEGGVWWPEGSIKLLPPSGAKKIPLNFTPTWPTNSILANKNVSTIKIVLSASPVQDRCIAGMPSDELVFRLKNPNYTPNAPLPAAQQTSEMNKKKPVSIIKQPVKPSDQRRR